MKSSGQTVFIVDDNSAVCDALRCLFESINLKVETYSNALMFLASKNNDQQGCLIIDVRLPGMSGLELLEHLKEQHSSLSIIMITGYGDIPMAVRAMKAGAADFVLKPFNEQCLLDIVQHCINSSTASALKTKSNACMNELIKCLTNREHQIIELIMEGNLNKQIAFALSISISTVEAHRANIMQKLQVKTMGQLIKTYLQAQYNECS